MRYPTKKLGEVLEKIVGGGTPSKSNPTYWNGDIPWASVKDLKDGVFALKKTRDSITEEGLKNSSANLIPKGVIVISTRMGLGRVVKTEISTAINQDLKALFPKRELDVDYLLIFLRAKARDIVEKGSGATVFGIRLEHLKDIEIPIPSIEEQKKIVARLEKQLAKIKEAKRLRAEADATTQSLLSTELHKIFEENRRIFKFIDLGSVAHFVRGPFGGSLRKDIFVQSGYAVYEQGNVIKNNLTRFRYFIDENKFFEMDRFSIQAKDILMSCSGTIGRLAVIPNQYEKGIINQALLKITPKSEVSTEYLVYALQDYISLHLAKHTTGSAIKNIVAVSLLKKIRVPLPPLEEQKKIVARLDALSEKIRKLREYQKSVRTDLDRLEQSVLHQAFSANE